MTTLYDILGVSQDASANELRRAYRERARQLHPDVNAAPGAEDAIRTLNDAWAILGDEARRNRYDAALAATAAVRIVAHQVTPRQPEATYPVALRILRPSVLMIAVLGIIFLVTAYAGPRSNDHGVPPSRTPSSAGRSTISPLTSAPAPDSLIGKCLLIQPGYDAVTPCNQPNNGQVVADVAQVAQCPPGSVGYQLAGRAQLVCLAGQR